MRTRLTLLLAAALLASVTLTATGAVPLIDQRDPVHEHVFLEPASGPGTNGEYARFDADGDLTLDLSADNPVVEGDGVADGTVTTIERVFTVTYNGSRNATVWLTDDSDAVTFVSDGEPFESESAAVTLQPNQSVSVGLRVDATGDGPVSVRTMTVHARLPEPEDAPATTTSLDDDSDVTTESDVGAEEDTTPGGVSQTRVRVTSTDGDYQVEVSNARAGEPVMISFGGDGSGNVRLESLSFVPRVDGEYDLLAAESDIDDFGTGGADATAVGYVRLDHTWNDDDVDDVAIEFSVTSSWLTERGVEPEAVTLYRFAAGEWSRLPTEQTGQRGDRYLFRATSPGLSVFAVADAAPTSPTPASSTPASEPSQANAEPATAAPPSEPGGFGLRPIFFVALALVVSLVGLRLYQRRTDQ